MMCLVSKTLHTQSHSVLGFLVQFWPPGPVGAVFCGVHAQMRSASRRTRPDATCIPTAPDPEKRTRNSIIS